MSDLAEKLSSLVQFQLPDFVRDNYDTFQAFLVAYYEFCEQNTEVQYAIQKSESYKDIDLTIDSFVDNFLTQYGSDIPKSIFLNQQYKNILLSNNQVESKRAFAKKLVNLYSSKGSEASIRLLFRLLFNDDITLYYPKEDVLKPSDGDWKQRQIIKIINNGDASTYSNTIGGIITGDTSAATGIVNDIAISTFLPSNSLIRIYEVEFEKDTLQGIFTENENVTFSIGNLTTGNLEVVATGQVIPLISSVEIVESGIGYSTGGVITGNNNYVATVSAVSPLGQIKEFIINSIGSEQHQSNVTIIPPAPSTSYTGFYEVTSNVATVVLVDGTGNAITHGLQTGDTLNVTFTTGLTGVDGTANVISVISTKKFNIANSNAYYTTSGNITVNPAVANLVATIGTVANYSGYYTDKNGHLSDIKKIHDSDYYQDYSYVIIAKQSSEYWKEIIKQVLHPAGMKLFSEVFIDIQTEVGAVSVTPTSPVYQTLLRFLRLISTSSLQPITPTSVMKLEITNRVDRSIGRWRNGSSIYTTLDQFKFQYDNLRIYDVADLTIDFIGSNQYNPIKFTPPNDIAQEAV